MANGKEKPCFNPSPSICHTNNTLSYFRWPNSGEWVQQIASVAMRSREFLWVDFEGLIHIWNMWAIFHLSLLPFSSISSGIRWPYHRWIPNCIANCPNAFLMIGLRYQTRRHRPNIPLLSQKIKKGATEDKPIVVLWLCPIKLNVAYPGDLGPFDSMTSRRNKQLLLVVAWPAAFRYYMRLLLLDYFATPALLLRQHILVLVSCSQRDWILLYISTIQKPYLVSCRTVCLFGFQFPPPQLPLYVYLVPSLLTLLLLLLAAAAVVVVQCLKVISEQSFRRYRFIVAEQFNFHNHWHCHRQLRTAAAAVLFLSCTCWWSLWTCRRWSGRGGKRVQV